MLPCVQRIDAVLGGAKGTGVRVLTMILILAFACASSAAAKGVLGNVHGSAEQVYTTGAKAGTRVTLVDRHGHAVRTRRVDRLGALLFRNVTPGKGYRLRSAAAAGGRTVASKPIKVFSDRSAPPSTRIYRQRIPAKGYGYLTTRDGVRLAIDVRLPDGKGPYPTLIEYAGYGYADPFHGPDSGIAQIANLLGFAVVDVNMRGTGCSGGAFDYFEPLQSLDGYDVIETVARQPWVLHHKVGMMGISYGGISQLFVAATAPPSLAAITPLSVVDETATTLYPGGILNTGFALAWAKDRAHDAQPASATGGEPWALQEIRAGDKTCKANQALHAEAADVLAKVFSNHFYIPSVADPLAPIKFVNKIKAPVYLACQFTDEQTGGHCPDLAAHFTGTRHKWFTFTNGVHTDSLDPASFNRWYDFLQLFVTRQRPSLPAIVKGGAPTLYNAVLGVQGVTLPNDPIQAQPTYAAALAGFEHLSQVRVLFDNGAGSSTPGNPYPGFERSFPRFPIPGTQARSWYLGAAGGLTDAKPPTAPPDRFTWNKAARPQTDFTGGTGGGPGGLWNATPAYNWTRKPAGTAASYLTQPLSANTTIVGAGAVQLWIKASTSDVDLQATVSEVRPDGKETFVQNGWLRASERKLDPKLSTLVAPRPSLRGSDVARLPKGRFTQLTVPLYYEGHAYRAGSRIRVTISAPNGDQPIWSFRNTVPTSGHATVFIAHSPSMPSRLVLPLVPGVSIPTALPPCPGLRGEPCRSYVPLTNGT
jgi:predicted acyl esterase